MEKIKLSKWNDIDYCDVNGKTLGQFIDLLKEIAEDFGTEAKVSWDCEDDYFTVTGEGRLETDEEFEKRKKETLRQLEASAKYHHEQLIRNNEKIAELNGGNN